MPELTQNQQILDYLKSGKKITPLTALKKFGCFRLSARIWDLRSQGYPISKKSLTTPQGKTVAEYYLEDTSDKSCEK